MFNKKERNVILDKLDLFDKYLQGEIGDIEISATCTNDKYKPIEDKLIKIIEHVKTKQEEDIKVFGEIMLVCEKFGDGFTDDMIIQQSTDHRINYIAKTINAMINKIHQASSRTLEVFKEYQSGDYRNKLDTSIFRGGNILALLENVNLLGDTITQMLQENKNNGVALDQNAQKLLVSATQMDNITNGIAASIEESAASLTEMTYNVKMTAENITKMAIFAQDVTHSLEQSESLAHETADSMQMISQGVKAIQDSIAIIDQITFQTNVLSLNAAVEAAKAGEHGRGFAVVAGEVRTLAGSTAEAAKSIKQLIASTTEISDKGAHTATEMIDGYRLLNENIGNSVALINDIDNASKEQYEAIMQINAAVNELDEQSQKSAIVATSTKDIAEETEQISQLILENIESKKFHTI